MLTLTETIDRIRALDTEADIITQACEKILRPEGDYDMSTEQGAVLALLEVYNKVQNPCMMIEALIQTLCGVLVGCCKSGHEITLLDGVLAQHRKNLSTNHAE